jgi:hypothetical protein
MGCSPYKKFLTSCADTDIEEHYGCFRGGTNFAALSLCRLQFRCDVRDTCFEKRKKGGILSRTGEPSQRGGHRIGDVGLYPIAKSRLGA